MQGAGDALPAGGAPTSAEEPLSALDSNQVQRPGSGHRNPTTNHHPWGGHPLPGTRLPRREVRRWAPWAGGSQGSWKRVSGGAPRKQTQGQRPKRPAPARSPGPGNINTFESCCFVYLNASLSPWRRGWRERVTEGGVREPGDRPARSLAPASRHTSAPEPRLPGSVGGDANWCSHYENGREVPEKE